MGTRRRLIQGLGAVVAAASLGGCVGLGDDAPAEPDDSEEFDDFIRVGPLLVPSVAPEWNPIWHETFVTVAEQLSGLGVEVTINPVELVDWIDRLVDPNRHWEAAANGRSGGANQWAPEVILGGNYHIDEAEPRGANHSWWGQGIVDDKQTQKAQRFSDLIDRAGQVTDDTERQSLVFEAQQLLSEDVPEVVLYYQHAMVGYNTETFEGWRPVNGVNPFGQAHSLQQLTPRNGETVVRFATAHPIRTLNYAAYNSRGADLQIRSSLLYDRLVELGFDATPRPALAESWEWENAQTLAMTLREGLTYDDGIPLTASDVKFTVEFNERWTPPRHRRRVSMIESVSVEDERSFTIRLEHPHVQLLALDLPQLPIIPEHVWADATAEHALEEPAEWDDPDLTGSGPMRVVELDLPDRLVYEVREDHWREFSFERFAVTNHGTSPDVVDALIDGDADCIVSVPAREHDRLQDVPGREAVSVPTGGYQKLTFRNESPPFHDLPLRRAFAHALDPTAIVEEVLQGRATVADTQTPIAKANEFWHNPDVETYEGGVERGREILREAGYRWTEEGQLMQPRSDDPLQGF